MLTRLTFSFGHPFTKLMILLIWSRFHASGKQYKKSNGQTGVASFFASFLFYFCFFPSISIDDMGATSGGFSFDLSFFSLFPNGFLLCDHGLDL